ncbi:MAG: hypothetical protein N2C12_10730, partial [Planctomycetales bacterium]
DVMPTILAACGIEVPDTLPGINLLDEKAIADRETIFFANFAHDMVSPTEPEKSVWTRSCLHNQWKLVTWQKDTPQVRPYNNGFQRKNPETSVELFDLLADPHETTNLAEKQPQVVKQMRERMDAWWDPGKPLP